MSTAASASMLGRGCMVGQTNLFPLVNRSKDGFAAKCGQACVGCRGETSPLLIRGCLAELPCQNQWCPAALHAAPALIQYITKLRV
jgi:hypothetical protein